MTRLLRLVFVGATVTAGVTLLTLCRALLEPSATWLEFLTHLKGISAVIAVIIPFTLGPIWFVFGRDESIAALRSGIINLCLVTGSRSIEACVALIIIDILGLSLANVLNRRPTAFDAMLERCKIEAFRFETASAVACLTRAEPIASTEKYHQRMDLARLCSEIATKMRDRAGDANDWRRMLANIQEWERLNNRSTFSRLALARVSAKSGYAEATSIAIQLSMISADHSPGVLECMISVNDAKSALHRNGDILTLEPGDVITLSPAPADDEVAPTQLRVTTGTRQAKITVIHNKSEVLNGD